MRPFCLAVALVLAASVPGHAQFVSPLPRPRACSCRSAVAAAERGNGIPAHLLAAITRVESGRRDPATGAVHPWPWTANAEGQGFFYETKAEAVAAVRAMQARGIRSIDVGCGQINLMHHPDAFPSLEMAFDPQANAAYAARSSRNCSPGAATGTRRPALYHSATPDLGEEYQRKVLAVWPEEQKSGRPDRRDAAGAGLGRHHDDRSTRIHARDPVTDAGAGARAAQHHAARGCRRGPDPAPIGLAYQPPPSRRIGG